MTSKSTRDTDDAPNAEPLFDPGSLSDHEDVEFLEHTNVHSDRDHCAIDVAGRAVVGVTTDDGAVLTMVHRDARRAVLPNGRVESGDDWAAVGRDAAEERTGVPVEIDGPERVRRVEHVTETDDEPHTTSHQVVFSASLAGGESGAATPIVADEEWRVEWLDGFPEGVIDDEGPAERDVRLFLD